MYYYLFTVGYSLSGKTWLVDKIKGSFPGKFESVETRSMHDFLNTMDLFKDDNTVDGTSYEIRQEATYELRKTMIEFLAKKAVNIIQDSGNQIKKDRQERVGAVKDVVEYVKTILIFVNPDMKVIEKRAIEADKRLVEEGKLETWVKLIEKQKERMEVPTTSEADYFLEYNGNDWESVISKLKNILNAPVAQLEEH
ncbi:hypothetical protein IT417_02560 [bacterium]|nr:hypothetical protein [bacterium]